VNDGPVVADASAILALLKQEPIELIDPRRLFGATASAVNLSEIIERLCAGGLEAEEADAPGCARPRAAWAFPSAIAPAWRWVANCTHRSSPRIAHGRGSISASR